MARSSEFLPVLAMVIVQVGYAGMNISSKIVMDSGMPPLVLVAYRQLFASFAIIPFAYFFERETWSTITKKVLFQVFLCSLFGASLNQIFYFTGLKNTTPTISCALNNMLPAITFIIAVPFGLEAVGIRTRGGQAKVLGTTVCVGGAMFLTLYHGHIIDVSAPFHLKLTDHAPVNHGSPNGHTSSAFGPLAVLAGSLALAIWFILQAKMSNDFAAPFTSSALLCSMAGIQCIVIAACTNPRVSDWCLRNRIRLVCSIYDGLVGSALSIYLMSWTIQRKGPLYVSVFSPLLLVIVAFMSWLLSMEKLNVGKIIGAVLIVLGLYSVLWGKSREQKTETGKMDRIGGLDQESKSEDLEKQQQQIQIEIVDLKEINNQVVAK